MPTSIRPRAKPIIAGLMVAILCIGSTRAQKYPKLILQDKLGASSAIISASGDYILTANDDLSVALWHVPSGKKVAYMIGESTQWDKKVLKTINDIFCKNGQQILIYDNWDSDVSTTIIQLLSQRIQFSEFTESVITKDQVRHLWQSMNINYLINTSRFSQDGNYVISYPRYVDERNRIATITSTSTLKQIAILKGHRGGINYACFSNNSTLAVTASDDSSAIVWNVKTGTVKSRLAGHKGKVLSVGFSPDQKKLVSVGADKIAKVWDLTADSVLCDLNLHRKDWNMKIATFSPITTDDPAGGKYILTSINYGGAVLWETATGKQVRKLLGHKYGSEFSSFSLDGQYFLTLSVESMRLWLAENGEIIEDFGYNTKPVKAKKLKLRKDGFLQIELEENQTLIWDMINLEIVYNKEIDESLYYDDLVADKERIMDKYVVEIAGSSIMVKNSHTGKLLSNLYFFFAGSSRNVIDYLATTDDGYYKCSHSAAKYINFVTGDLKILNFEQFDIKYNRPDELLKSMESSPSLIYKYRKAYEKRLKNLDINPFSLEDGYILPTSEISNINDIAKVQTDSFIRLDINGSISGKFLHGFNVFVNDVPVYGKNGIDISRFKKHKFDTSVSITLSNGLNVISTSFFDENNMESLRKSYKIFYKPKIPPKSRLYFLGIGIDKFQDSSENINWCTNDIRKFEHNNVCHGIDSLLNFNVTKRNILAKRKILETLTEEDRVIVFYAGHGIVQDNRYFLSTYPIDFRNPSESGLEFSDLENLLDGIRPRKKLMLLDACRSGNIDKEVSYSREVANSSKDQRGAGVYNADSNFDAFDLAEKLFFYTGKSNGTTIISAASGIQSAKENEELKGGIFAHFVVKFFNEHPIGTVNELKEYLIKEVSNYTKGTQVPTVRMENKVLDWALNSVLEEKELQQRR